MNTASWTPTARRDFSVKVAGEGADPGDKSVCKAQTSALKYALLQSFLIATGDDPEADSGKSGDRGKQSSRNGRRGHITAAQAQEIRRLIDETGTELEKVLEHFHVRSIAEMNEGNYRKALTCCTRSATRPRHRKPTPQPRTDNWKTKRKEDDGTISSRTKSDANYETTAAPPPHLRPT